MAYSLYTQSFGPSNAFVEVFITEVGTGLPASVLTTAGGGVLSLYGRAVLDGDGELSVYIDTARTWRIAKRHGGVLIPSTPVVTTAGNVVSASRNLELSDNNRVLECTTTLTLTIPSGLPNGFSFAVIPKGVVSIASSGGVLINGATSTISKDSSTVKMFAVQGEIVTPNVYLVL